MKHHVRLLVLLSCVLAASLFIACGSDGKEKNPGTEPLPRFALNSLSVNGDSITFAWTDPAVSGFDHVDITYSGTSVSVGRGAQTKVISGLAPESMYTITAAFVDAEGNRSQAVVFSARTESIGSASVDFTRVDTASKLDNVRNDLGGNYLLVADLDLSGFSSWSPIGDGSARFSGIFNGNGHTIENLTIASSDESQGLFGIINGGIVNDLKIDLVGYNESVIENCYSISAVHATGIGFLGGLVGFNEGSVSNCYAAGTLTGPDYYRAGLVGGSMSAITNSFYDSATTGMSDTDRGTPKTTSEMKTKTTFTDAGWDFAGETTNGSSDLWDIESTINDGYPYLKGLADLY